jgi:hypothetical protein
MLQFAHELQPGSIQIARECWRHVVAAWCRAQKTAVSLVCLNFTTVFKKLQSACILHVHQDLLCFGCCHAHDAMVWHLTKLHGRIQDVTAPKIYHSRSERYSKQLMLLRGNAALTRQPCHYRYSRYRQHMHVHDLDRCLDTSSMPSACARAWHYLHVVM